MCMAFSLWRGTMVLFYIFIIVFRKVNFLKTKKIVFSIGTVFKLLPWPYWFQKKSCFCSSFNQQQAPGELGVMVNNNVDSKKFLLLFCIPYPVICLAKGVAPAIVMYPQRHHFSWGHHLRWDFPLNASQLLS